MAQTTQQILERQIGAMVVQLASLQAQLEAAREELAALKAPARPSRVPAPSSDTLTAVGS